MLFSSDMPTPSATCRHTRKKTGRGAYWLLLNEPIIRVLAPLIAKLVTLLIMFAALALLLAPALLAPLLAPLLLLLLPPIEARYDASEEHPLAEFVMSWAPSRGLPLWLSGLGGY
jgi:hypothetical protein